MGNLIYRELPNGEKQYFQYDTENQLTRAEIKKPQGNTEIWEYAYDPFGRRLSKERTDKGSLKSTDPKRTVFIWDGSRLLQEYNYRGNYTYIYTDQDSYEPLAQVFYNNKDDKQYLSYYHTDQIGIPREMTDQFGNLLWFGEYTAWGCLKDEKRIYQNAHQPFRLQNQYFDSETGLHYNLFRYYEPDTGRFVNQDPIGLVGGYNFYNFAPNALYWIDPLGWEKNSTLKPGPFAKESIPAHNGASRKFTAYERSEINRIGNKYGCHTCGAKTPGTKSGNWIPDHQNPNGLNSKNKPQRLYPHCQTCSRRQGGEVRSEMARRAAMPVSSAQASPIVGMPKMVAGWALLFIPNQISKCQDLSYFKENPEECR